MKYLKYTAESRKERKFYEWCNVTEQENIEAVIHYIALSTINLKQVYLS